MDDAGRAELEHLLRWVQDGVVERSQLSRLGATPNDVRRMLRRGELHPYLPGVYLVHNGPPTWEQRAWAAVLRFAPAALGGASAFPDPPVDMPIQVVVGHHRQLQPIPGVVVRRFQALGDRIVLHSAPPRLRLEHAAIDLTLTAADSAGRYRVLADAIGTRRTSPEAIAGALRERGRVPHRAELRAMLDDLAAGADSVLERGYLLLERRHGLPRAIRQARVTSAGGAIRRDVHYERYDLIVELDGRAHHDHARARERDFERDLEAASSGVTTVRLTYGQVFSRGCRTAARVATLLQRGGWPGKLRPCPVCPVGRTTGTDA